MFTRARLCMLLGLVLAAAPVMFAPTFPYPWTGNTSGDFSLGSNWSANQVPPNDGTAGLVFGATTHSNITLTSSFNADELFFNGTNPFYSIQSNPESSAVTLGIGSGGIYVSSANMSSAAIYGSGMGYGLNLRLNANQTWVTDGALMVYAPISDDSAATPPTLTKSGAGSLTLGFNNTFRGGLTVASARSSSKALRIRAAAPS
jgi:autotransporter-associated beta strand protein